METKHTCTPWEAECGARAGGIRAIRGQSRQYGMGDIICDCFVTADGPAEGNRAVIIACVNACAEVNPVNPIAAAKALPGLLAACEGIRDARDYNAEYGYYPPGMLSNDQCFDDWAADVADNAVVKAKKGTE